MVTSQIRLLTIQNKTKQKKSFPLADLCGPLLQWFPITVGDPVPTHNPLLGVQFRSFCFVSARFFHTCFCAAVFPSAGGTTLLAVVLLCSRNLCWAPAICQTHTLMVVGTGVYSGNGGVWIQSKTVEKVQLMLSYIGPYCQHIVNCVNSAVCESGAIWQHDTNCLKWSCEDHRVFKLLALLFGLNFIYQVMDGCIFKASRTWSSKLNGCVWGVKITNILIINKTIWELYSVFTWAQVEMKNSLKKK